LGSVVFCIRVEYHLYCLPLVGLVPLVLILTFDYHLYIYIRFCCSKKKCIGIYRSETPTFSLQASKKTINASIAWNTIALPWFPFHTSHLLMSTLCWLKYQFEMNNFILLISSSSALLIYSLFIQHNIFFLDLKTCLNIKNWD
jgi:hypothetical protein